MLIGGPLGLRKYAVWDAVPQAAHVQLTNSRKEALKASYDSALLGREVVETMLDTLRFFFAVICDRPQGRSGRNGPGSPL